MMNLYEPPPDSKRVMGSQLLGFTVCAFLAVLCMVAPFNMSDPGTQICLAVGAVVGLISACR